MDDQIVPLGISNNLQVQGQTMDILQAMDMLSWLTQGSWFVLAFLCAGTNHSHIFIFS